MRIALLLPCHPSAMRGNGTTAARLVDGLKRSRHQLSTHQVGEELPQQCDLLIALNSTKSGPGAHQYAHAQQIPFIILFTGTDLNGRPGNATTVAVNAAAALVTLGTSSARRARDLFPDCGKRLSIIPQAVSPLPEARGAALPEALAELEEDAELVFMPTGLRAIKNPERAVTALAPLAQTRPQLRLWIAGEELEEGAAVSMQELCRKHPFARWLGPIPRDQLAAFMRRAKAVISTSKSEGGPPNALLEAGLLARPLLASDIPAHREFPGGSRLFKDDRGLRRKLAAILDDPDQALLAATSMREEVRQGFAAAREAAAWSALVHKFV